MHRRDLLRWTSAAVAASLLDACRTPRDPIPNSATLDARWFERERRFTTLPFGRIAHVERGSGPVALFLHGAPLNGFQWRGALERLSGDRRCLALDFMGLGYSEPNEGQSLAGGAQAEMVIALLDALKIDRVDLVASDSGTAVAQLLMARVPGRIRTALLTNGDVEIDSPPEKVKPAIQAAREGKLAAMTEVWLTDRALARSTFGAAVFHDPTGFSDETIDCYVRPLVSSPRKRAQYEAFHLALEPNPIAGIESSLRTCTVPTRLVWGTADPIFSIADAEYLSRLLPRSQGIREVPDGKLFFPEEFPDLIAEEARLLWRRG